MKEHLQLERFTNNWLTSYRSIGKDIYCRKGCSGCCNLAVHATYPEAVLVAGELNREHTDKLRDYVSRLKTVLPQLSSMKDYLETHRRELGTCPFLDAEGSCSIYSIRPLSCRALLSTRPAAWCTVDFSELSEWDKQAYESSLDRHIVAWPTHYVAATQDFAHELENCLLESMKKSGSWRMSGNFAVMVWLEQQAHLSEQPLITRQQVHDILLEKELDSQLVLNLFKGKDSA